MNILLFSCHILLALFSTKLNRWHAALPTDQREMERLVSVTESSFEFISEFIVVPTSTRASFFFKCTCYCVLHFQTLWEWPYYYFGTDILNETLYNISLIKSPQYTGGDFMFLYRFVRRRCRPQILVHAITFEQLFGFLSFLAWLLALTYRLTD